MGGPVEPLGEHPHLLSWHNFGDMCHFSIAHKVHVSHSGQDIFKLTTRHDTLPVRIFPDGSVKKQRMA